MTRGRLASLPGGALLRGTTGMIASTGFSVGTKALQAVASFATVHRLVHLWGLSGYGLWVTLTAFSLYMTLFDMGVGYGVKNRISEAWGRGDVNEADQAVRAGTAVYFAASMLALVAGAVVVGFVAPFKDHRIASGIVWVACVGSFFMSFHNMVLQGLARFKTLALLGLLAPCAWFAALQLWPATAAFPMELGATIYSVALLLQGSIVVAVSRRVHAFAVAGWYRTPWHQLQVLLRTGGQFLALQIATFALNGSGTFLVYRSLGGTETAQYDAANKVFSIFTIAFTSLIAIAWTEISRAKAAGDHQRMANARRLLHGTAFALIAAAMVACYASAPLTRALTGIEVPTSATVAFVVFIGLQMLAYTSSVFLNAFERLQVQIIAAIVSVPVFFAVAFALLSAGWGMPSIPIASAIATLPSLIVCFPIARRLVAPPAPGALAAV